MFSIFTAIKTWWLELVYGSKDDIERKAWMDREFPGWDEEYENAKQIKEEEEDNCSLCGKSQKEYKLIMDDENNLYCETCYKILYDQDMNYAEGIGYYKKLK